VTFGGHGWRSGAASDITGAASTATVTVLSPTSFQRNRSITLTVTGTGFTAQSVIYAGYSPVATVFDSATQLHCSSFNTTPDSGNAGPIPIGVRKAPTEALSNTINFNAT